MNGGAQSSARLSDAMCTFFDSLSATDRADSTKVAERYGSFVVGSNHRSLIRDAAQQSGTLNIGVANVRHDLAYLTKRAMLISDSLVLTHVPKERPVRSMYGGMETPDSMIPTSETLRLGYHEPSRGDLKYRNYAMYEPQGANLGRWLLDCESLFRKGLLAYNPFIETVETHLSGGYAADDFRLVTTSFEDPDYRGLIVDGSTLIEVPRQPPRGAHSVIPVLTVELPFIDAATLSDFSTLTVDEFGSFETFRDFLRDRFLSLEETAGSVHFESDLTKIGIEIRDGVKDIGAELNRANRKRAISSAGAAIASTTATLVAVLGPELATALSAMGASGGVRGLVDGNFQTPDEKPYYYLWLLQHK